MMNQKPTAKKAHPPKAPQKGFMDELRQYGRDLKKIVLGYVSNLEKFKNILENNYNLGRDHLSRSNIQDAILRFKFVIWLDPTYKDSWYYLGCSLLADGKTKAARNAFAREIKLHPTSAEARYMLAITTGKALPKAELPKIIPLDLLQSQFDTLAPTFTDEQVGAFKYEGHTQLSNAVRSAIIQGRIDHIILEPGVGTGLCGPLMRDVAAHITGVDLSPAMLLEAQKVTDERGKKIYDALINREAVAFLTDGPDSSYDIIMAAGLVSYMGELQPFFEQSARILKTGGILAFTADAFDGNSFQFNPEIGRFGYSQYYLADLATRFGLTEYRCREALMYPESAGWLCVYRK